MMDDDQLSQEEIDALLNIADDADADDEDSESSSGEADSESELDYLSSIEIDAIGEIGNISLGSSATTLSTLLNHKVEITTPSVSFVRKTGEKEEFPYEHVSLQVNFVEGFNGENIFLMKAVDAAIISDIMLGGEGTDPKEELTEIELSAVQEAMNQMMGASATSMSTVFDKRIDISPPSVNYEDIDRLEEIDEITDEEEVLVKVAFQLKVGDLIDSTMTQLIPLQFARTLVDQLLNPEEGETATSLVEEETMEQENVKVPTGTEKVESTVQVEREEQPTVNLGESPTEPQQIGFNVGERSDIQKASFMDFEQVDLSQQGQHNLDLLLDIPLKVTVELGRTKQTVQEVLDLSPGSIVELDKLAGEPVDVLVNGKLIAKGEVVVIDENFGVRITDILNQKDRLMKLN